MIDAHIHLDQYDSTAQTQILQGLPTYGVERVVAVSMDLNSSEQTRQLYLRYPERVLPAYGFHPEQSLPPTCELDELFTWIRAHREEVAAIGEVGLPYYRRREAEKKGECFNLAPYVTLLERFVAIAAELHQPIALHAVYEDAAVACDLLEAYGVTKAHFHWFKGDETTVQRMIDNGYYISFTPDLLYEPSRQQLAKTYPLQRVMVETDGPWPFDGPFRGQRTHPRMVAAVIRQLAEIKGLPVDVVAQTVRENTLRLYG
ncbi:TatD family hydrolase [Numidum massiliense]|uniref:TatD family hydrolase n=1 Tax=Numidum massiliense TaxID=1522315 RepID=UPI0006D59534|nr:TatD family hydrolase [Numidum massiliense]